MMLEQWQKKAMADLQVLAKCTWQAAAPPASQLFASVKGFNIYIPLSLCLMQ